MRHSKIFTRSQKLAKEYDSQNATLLMKAGFIDQVMAGVYTYLPLGMRVLRKIEKVVREEMDKVANEVLFPALSPRELWEKTGRLEKIDVMLQVNPANKPSAQRNAADYILNSTHEELATPVAQQYATSYKNLPLAFYQLQSKFRNEPRPKSGLMRGREFLMKDGYSFHADLDDFQRYYEEMKQVYMRIYTRLGIGETTIIALASGGDFTDDYSHEFQTKSEAGEDTIFYDKKEDVYYNKEVTASKAPAVTYSDSEMLEIEEKLGEHIIGVEELAEFLGIEVERTTKTMLFKADSQFVAVAVRGGYEVDEIKLLKVLGCEKLEMATAEEVEQVTGTVPGYVGLLGLPESVQIIIDESCDNRLNFEIGANKENYHSVNVNWGRDLAKPNKFYDIKVAKEGDLNPTTEEVYEVFKASEVGNIFPLGTKFSDDFGFRYTDSSGKPQPVYMGSYGIGPSRVMGVIAENFNDDKGLIWPAQVAPFQIYLIDIGAEAEATKLYEQLTQAGFEVLYDDRDLRPGEKFGDADLYGIPVRIVISKKTLADNQIELKQRTAADVEFIKLAELESKLSSIL